MSQPWAELLVSGKKKIEVRTKNTNYRGWFYVYAAKKDTKDEVVSTFGFQNLPSGVLIGRAFLEDVKAYHSDQEFYEDSKFHLATKEIIELEGWDLKKRYGYIIGRVEKIKPIPYRGMPGFFPVNLELISR